MKILALERELPGATPEQFGQHRHAEAARVWELHQEGTIRELYFRADRHDAVLVLECESIEHAEQVLTTLPFVSHGLTKFDLIPLIAYSGFAHLFA